MTESDYEVLVAQDVWAPGLEVPMASSPSFYRLLGRRQEGDLVHLDIWPFIR